MMLPDRTARIHKDPGDEMNTLWFQRWKYDGGFTLLEVLIALSILSIGLLTLAEMTTYVIRGNTLGSKITRATVLAEDKLEELTGLSYADPQLNDSDGDSTDFGTRIDADPNLFTSPDHTDDYPADSTDQTVTIKRSQQRVWNVAEDTPGPGMKTVTVIVGWKGTKDHFVALSTIIGK